MIIKEFDNGWGTEYTLKKHEKSVVDRFLARFIEDNIPTVLINSTWYSQQYHFDVLNQIVKIKPQRIVLVSLLDASIPKVEWFQDLVPEIYTVGYYPGSNEIDYWALMVNQYMDLSSYDKLMTSDLIDTPYMCLNRKPHRHRMNLYHQLMDADLLDHGLVSMGSDNGTAIRVLPLD